MYIKSALNNGIRVVYEKIPYIRSVCAGIWIGTGSSNENQDINGISHYIEHMLFKGTYKRTAKEIAEAIDNIGGQINAFTGKECTCYYTKTLDTHFDIAIDVLSDMIYNSKFDENDLKIEKRVIIEEINMYEDSPEELVHDVLSETVWKGSSLGSPILGTKESLEKIKRKSIHSYLEQQYIPENIVISIAGNVEYEYMMDLLESKFNKIPSKNNNSNSELTAKFNMDKQLKEKETEQIHLCIGFESLEHGNESLYTLMAVNNIFGGGMSSHLFQKIREELGLVYSIYAYPTTYRKSGLYTIYAGMNPEHTNKVYEMIFTEINKLKKNGISKDELDKSKEQLKGSYILGLESTSGRMNTMGKSELLLGRIYTPDEVLTKIDNINLDMAKDIINRIFNTDKIGVAAVGNIKSVNF